MVKPPFFHSGVKYHRGLVRALNLSLIDVGHARAKFIATVQYGTIIALGHYYSEVVFKNNGTQNGSNNNGITKIPSTE